MLFIVISSQEETGRVQILKTCGQDCATEPVAPQQGINLNFEVKNSFTPKHSQS